MVHHIGCRGHRIAQGRNGRCAPDGIQFSQPPQLFRDSDQVHRLIAAVEIHNGRKDGPVVRTVKIILIEDFSRLVDGFPADQHGSQHTLFRLDILGWDTFFQRTGLLS